MTTLAKPKREVVCVLCALNKLKVLKQPCRMQAVEKKKTPEGVI